MIKETKITFAIAAVIIIALVAFMAVSPKTPASTQTADPAYLFSTSSHMTGAMNAQVTVVEFGDYQCPACGAAFPIVQQLIAAYASDTRVNFVFRNFPLSQHPNAMIAAEAAEAAGAQGKFWQMHDMLYQNQDDWADSATPIDFFVQYATTLGLNITKFKQGVENAAYQNVIAADQSDGEALGVAWTPTFYINGVLQQTTPTFDQFKSQIDGLLGQ